MPRKIIQIAAIQESQDMFGAIVALCDDGSVWYGSMDGALDCLKWIDAPPIPQDDENKE